MTADNDLLLTALGSAMGKEFKAARLQTEASLDAIREELRAVDGSAVLKSATARLLALNLSALRAYADGVRLKKSVSVSGKPPDIVAKTL